MARSTKRTAEDGDPRITVPTDRVESRDLSEPRELSLEEVLKSYEQPINEEQAWAVCYQCCSGLRGPRPPTAGVSPVKGPSSILLHRDGTVALRTRNSEPKSPSNNFLPGASSPGHLFSRALDDVRRSRGQSCRNEDRLGPVSKKEPQPWKPQQLQEENRAEPVQECRSSQRMQPSEESWQQEIRDLKELLVGKDQQICRVEQERRTLAEAHVDTLALLSSTQAALKQEEGKCARLQEQCSKNLDDEELRHQTQLKTKQMVSDLTKKCEVIWTETQRKLEEMLGNQERISEEKESSTRKEIHLLTQRIVQLQQLLREKETKKKQKMKFRIMKFFFGR
ncbi:Protein spire -like protein 2 [Takifugu flavidus]|uniref:Protein spire-like protein 2 n=1 Tax=Takifugu flavidus TaxID=433684 RepID=A0A5C6P946_9TELE|nr:Protein spire -like protein 2 [Takifugu flavidus]